MEGNNGFNEYCPQGTTGIMFQETVYGYVIQALILGQALFWMWLYDSPYNFPDKWKYSFIQGSAGFLIISVIMKFEIGYYTNHLIILYVLMTLLSVYIYYQRKPLKEAVCLGFLTVYLNSYYWELPLHLAEILSGTLHVGMIVQLWHLIPIPFLFKHFKFQPNTRATLSIGLAFSATIMVLRFFFNIGLSWIVWMYLYDLVRIVCLILLTKVIIEANPKNS